MEFYNCEFEWHENKNKTNVEKHGVPFQRAKVVFRSSSPKLTKDDTEHSQYEQRYKTIGRCKKNKFLTVIHTRRGNRIRIISAWRSTESEKECYYEYVSEYLPLG